MEIRCYPYGPLQANSYMVLFGTDAIIIDPCVVLDAMELESIVIHGIFCTHGHFDHIYEAERLRQRNQAVILAHEKECSMMMTGDGTVPLSINIKVSVSPPICQLKDGDVLRAQDFGFSMDSELEIRVIHTPGHTNGSICLLFTEKDSTHVQQALFSGDTILYETIGRTDLGGSMEDMLRSIKKLGLLPDDVKVYPGHGPSTTIGHEKRNNPYFTQFQ